MEIGATVSAPGAQHLGNIVDSAMEPSSEMQILGEVGSSAVSLCAMVYPRFSKDEEGQWKLAPFYRVYAAGSQTLPRSTADRVEPGLHLFSLVAFPGGPVIHEINGSATLTKVPENYVPERRGEQEIFPAHIGKVRPDGRVNERRYEAHGWIGVDLWAIVGLSKFHVVVSNRRHATSGGIVSHVHLGFGLERVQLAQLVKVGEIICVRTLNVNWGRSDSGGIRCRKVFEFN